MYFLNMTILKFLWELVKKNHMMMNK